MTEKEAFEEIITRPKWYAGLRNNKEQFFNAQSASKVKKRYKQGVLGKDIIEYVVRISGYTKVKEAEYQSSFNTDK